MFGTKVDSIVLENVDNVKVRMSVEKFQEYFWIIQIGKLLSVFPISYRKVNLINGKQNYILYFNWISSQSLYW
jgi:hypothetical protein